MIFLNIIAIATGEKHQGNKERAEMASSEIQAGCNDSRGLLVGY